MGAKIDAFVFWTLGIAVSFGYFLATLRAVPLAMAATVLFALCARRVVNTLAQRRSEARARKRAAKHTLERWALGADAGQEREAAKAVCAHYALPEPDETLCARDGAQTFVFALVRRVPNGPPLDVNELAALHRGAAGTGKRVYLVTSKVGEAANALAETLDPPVTLLDANALARILAQSAQEKAPPVTRGKRFRLRALVAGVRPLRAFLYAACSLALYLVTRNAWHLAASAILCALAALRLKSPAQKRAL